LRGRRSVDNAWMKGWMPALGVLLVAAGVVMWGLHRRVPPAAPVVLQAAQLDTPPASTPVEPPLPRMERPALGQRPGTLPAVAQRFAAARDYYDFAESVFAAAQAGDGEAQFYLSEALTYCDVGYKLYFRKDGTRRSLEEAQLRVSSRTTWEIDEVQRVHERCHRIQEGEPSQFGKAAEWMKRARNERHPVALARMAGELAGKIVSTQSELPEGTPLSAADLALRDRARELALEALRSRDPAAIFEAGFVADLFGPRDEPYGTRFEAWALVACQRGLDCSPEAPWVEFLCRNDTNCQPGESGLEWIRRRSNNSLEIERLAAELGAKLDAGKWNELGFDVD
jgi:hypothetical protein